MIMSKQTIRNRNEFVRLMNMIKTEQDLIWQKQCYIVYILDNT